MLPCCERGRRYILSPQISAQTPKARLVEVVYYYQFTDYYNADLSDAIFAFLILVTVLIV